VNEDSTNPASGLRDLATAKAWAADDASTETLLARLYQQWPAVHPELAGNPRTPVYLLARLANSDDPAIIAAIRRNPTAVASSIRPRTPWPAPTASRAEPAPLGQSQTQHCPNPACQATVRPEQVRCFSCGMALRGDITGVIPATVATTGWSADPSTAETTATAVVPPDAGWPIDPAAAATAPLYGINAVRTVTPFGAVPGVATPPRGTESAKVEAAAGAGAAGGATAAVGGGGEGKGRFTLTGKTLDSSRARVGPVGLLGFFALLGMLAVGLLSFKLISANKADTRAQAEKQISPKPPKGAASPATPTTVSGVGPQGSGATTAVIPVVVAAEPSVVNNNPDPAPASTEAPAPETTPPPATVAATTKTTKAAPAPTTAPTTVATTAAAPVTTLGTKSATTPPNATPSQLTSLAQEYANALASKNADLVKALNPSQSGDLSGYKYLDASTVIPVSMSSGADPHTMKLGLIAHEVTSTGKRTIIYCANWKLNIAKHTVTPTSGRELKTMKGIIDPATLVSDVQKNCG
jgi:hypothetical protein